MKRAVIALQLLILTVHAALAAATNTPADELVGALAAARQKFDIVGLSVAALRAGRLERQVHLGWADVDRRVPVTDRTKFRVASISKPVTATALMQLWEQGRFKLDDPVGGVLGYPVVNPHHPDQPITFRQLLTHTASFADGPAYDDFLTRTYNDPLNAPGFEELLCPGGTYYRNGAVYSTNAPGTRYAYSNLGFGLLGTLVEKLSGERFDEYCARHIFAPLGMRASFNPATLPEPTQLAVLYRPGTNGWLPQFDHYLDGAPTNRVGAAYRPGRNALPCAPQGGLRASVGDLARFLRVFADPAFGEATGVLRQTTIRIMLGRSESGGAPGSPLAFHRSTRLVPGETWIGHTGSAYGFFGLMFFQEDGPQGVILLTNGSRSGPERNGFTPMEQEIVAALREYLEGHSPVPVQR